MSQQSSDHIARRPIAKRLGIGLLILLGLGTVWFVTALILFVFPQQQPLHSADAVVTLAPASTRLTTAMGAVDQGLAPLLWVSYLPTPTQITGSLSTADRVCAPDAPNAATATCFTPDASATIGEARAVAELVKQSGATQLIVTTNTSHAARARFIFERCLPEGTEIQMLLVDDPDSHRYIFGRMTYETGAFIKAVAETSDCRR